MDLRGRNAIVTGASSGIGAATAVALARAGAASVTVVARRPDELEVTRAACAAAGADAFAHPADVSDRSACEGVIAAATARAGTVDVLVNNAGVSLHAPAADATVEQIQWVMGINFFGAVYLTMAVLPGMVQQRRGSIVNVTSLAGYIPNPNESAYGASKAALSLWTHGLAVDLHGTGVHAGVVSPGPIDTEIWEKDPVPSIYEGRKYPPQIVADAIVTLIRRDGVHVTIPRVYGLVPALYPILQRQLRWGLLRFRDAGMKKLEKRGLTRGGG